MCRRAGKPAEALFSLFDELEEEEGVSSALESSGRSAGAMESSGATLKLPPFVRPELMVPLDWAPPPCMLLDASTSSS